MRKTETETNNYRSQYWGLMAKKNWAKGRAAEKIVEEMFEELGFSVHKYGVEHSLSYQKNSSNAFLFLNMRKDAE